MALVLPGMVRAANELIKDEITEGLPHLSELLLRAAANRFSEPERSRRTEEYAANLEMVFGKRHLSGLTYALFTYLVAPRRARAVSGIEHGGVPFTTLGLGGPAQRLVVALDEREIVAAVTEADAAGTPLAIMGGGSRVVIADESFAGTVVRVASRGIERSDLGADRVRLDVAAGEDWDHMVSVCVAEGLAGCERMSGIPGSVGAAPIVNVGAYGQEIADVIVGVRAFDRATRTVKELSPQDWEFGYRSSVFRRDPGRWVILRVSFLLQRSERSMTPLVHERAMDLGVGLDGRPTIRDVRDAVLYRRRSKGMAFDPMDPDSVNPGPFFRNPEVTTD